VNGAAFAARRISCEDIEMKTMKRELIKPVAKKVLALSGLSALALSAAVANAFELSTNIPTGKSIPADYYWNSFGCSGKNKSPMLEWKNAPAGTKSFAITFHDEDAPTGSGFWHYVAYDLPADTSRVAEDALSKGALPEGTVEGNTDLGKPGFFGPCPPAGRKHNYTYTVHALKVEKLGVPKESTAAFVSFNLWMNTLGKASFKVSAGPRS
jgi:Raf kinase inhibitor-like YbhB/YbcL family protein